MIRKRLSFLSAVLVLPLVLFPAAAMAQEATPSAVTPPATVAPPKNLRDALPNLRWDPAEKGPLLIVAPQAVPPAKTSKDTNAILPPSLVNGVYRQSDLLDYFGYRLVRLRGVTVFAPAEMVVLNTDLGKPDLYSRLRLRDKLQMLETTLTPAQWQIISSPAGLGIGDTEGEQRALFDSLLPDPFVYQIRKMPPVVDASGTPEPPVRKTITATQRSGIRLRMHRETQFQAPSTDSSSPWSAASVAKKDPAPFRLSVYETPKFAENSFYGATLSQTVPSRLKVGQIDFDSAALNPLIALADAATVGDLIDRIRRETRIEIYADRRLARLPLSVRAAPGARLRVGDALKALCWGVSGAVRYVSDSENSKAGKGVFLLTDDLKGLGSRLGRIAEWAESAFNAELTAKHRLDQVIRQKNVLQHIGFAPDEIFKPTAEQMSAIEKAWTNETVRFLGTAFPVDVLPPDLQERVRRTAREANAARTLIPEGDQGPPISDSNVLIAVRLGLRLEVPEVGSIALGLGATGGLDSFIPPPEYSDLNGETLPKQITLLPTLKVGGVLCVTPENEEDARTVIRAARSKGLRQVWIGVLPDKEDSSAKEEDTEYPRILAAAIQESQETGVNPVSVLAVARVLSVPRRKTGANDDTSGPKSTLDVTIDGLPETTTIRNRLGVALQSGEEMQAWEALVNETRDWLVPDAPGVVSHIAERLRKLAETPGLGGIVLTDLLAPGYRVPKSIDANDQNTFLALGYTATRRVAAIRTIGYDPVDIVSDGDSLFSDVPQPAFYNESLQQSLLKDIYKTPEQLKTLGAALEKDDVQAIAEVSPIVAWNTFRFQAAGELVRKVFTALSAAAKSRLTLFPIYLQSMVNSDGGEWFGTWDQPDKLPIIQSIQTQEDYATRLERSARAASKTVLYSHSFQPNDQVPLPPAEKFVFDFNRILGQGRRSWDGYVFDLRDQPVDKALEILQSVVPPHSVK